MKYYINLEKFLTWKYFKNKIPIVKIKNNNYYNPVVISQYALANFDQYITNKNIKYLDRFYDSLNWIINNYNKNDLGYLWMYEYDNIGYPIQTPYISAMAQGEIISTLYRASLIDDNNMYKKIAAEAFKPMTINVKKGGLSIYSKDGIWLEEIPSIPHSYILNGFIFAIFGVYDLYKLVNKISYNVFYNKCIGMMENKIKYFDSNYWSYYDLIYKIPTNLNYHLLHIDLLNSLYNLTDNYVFRYYADKFFRYNNRKYRILSRINRNKGRLFTTLKNPYIIKKIISYYIPL